MPSQRRFRTIAILAVLTLIIFFYFTGSVSKSDQTFYDRTVAALQTKHDAHQHRMGSGAVAESKLREAAKQAHQDVVAEAEERRKKDSDPKEGTKGAQQKVLGGVDETEASESKQNLPHEVGSTQGKWTKDKDEPKDTKPEKTDEEHEVDAELTSILKRSPIIIFSKSYCPHSKKAKGIFAKYKITPQPFIVELDQHPLGPKLQDKLLDTTGRRTVPNVLISGKSIGGGDDVEALDHDHKLIETIKTMGGKRIMEAKLAD